MPSYSSRGEVGGDLFESSLGDRPFVMVPAVLLLRDVDAEANDGSRIETHDGRRRASCLSRSSSDVLNEASDAVSSSDVREGEAGRQASEGERVRQQQLQDLRRAKRRERGNSLLLGSLSESPPSQLSPTGAPSAVRAFFLTVSCGW